MKTIKIIRHAESESNAGLKTEHPKTIELTSLWKKQAQKLADSRSSPVDTIIYSKYDRTYQSAKPLINKFPMANIFQHNLIHEFTYLNPVLYCNTTHKERLKPRESFWSSEDINYKDDISTESVQDLITRVVDFTFFLKALTTLSNHNNIVIFSHGEFIRLLLDVLWDSQYDPLNDKKSRIRKLFEDRNTAIRNMEVIDLTKYF